MTTDFPDLGLKVMISNTPSEITLANRPLMDAIRRSGDNPRP
jgi:hypothetical protein